MATAIRPIGHEDRLSLVEHLDELRTRLIISGAVLVVVFGFCLWQNHSLLHVLNTPLQAETKKQVAKGEGTVGQAVLAQQGLLKLSHDTRAALEALARPNSGLSPAARAQLPALIASMKRDVAKIPRNPVGDNPVTLGVGEPFTTTITVSLLFALVISLPLILYEVYGFVVPALSPDEKRAARPLLTSVPVLFAAGVAFGYFVVLPAAVRFFVNFNASEFNVLVQASQFYKFAATLLLAMGLFFQVPVVILGATRLGLVSVKTLRRSRPYALVVCAAIAALLPSDVITMILETVPLYVLYEASILVAAFAERRTAAAEARSASAGTARASAPTIQEEPVEQSVQQIIDHVDPKHTS
jgi:sec-independent protein translocase protein TatC